MSRAVTSFRGVFVASVMTISVLLMQLNINLFAEGDYKGIRLALSDFTLLPVGLIIIGLIITNKCSLPSFRLPYTYIFITALSVWFIVSLPLWQTNEYSQWAIINKGIGWFVLLSYFMLGAWISSLSLSTSKNKTDVLIKFSLFFLIVSIVSIPEYIYEQINSPRLWPDPFSGTYINRNAWAFAALSAIIVSTFLSLDKKPRVSVTVVSKMLWTFVPFLLITYNGSRAGIGLTLFLVIFFCFYNFKDFFRLIRLPSIGLMIVCIISYSFFPQHFLSNDQVYKMAAIEDQLLGAEDALRNKQGLRADQVRSIVFQDSIELWSQSPITGTGIGSFIEFQNDKHGYLIEIIDSTPLWILTEMGLIGFVLFGAFFVSIGVSLWKRSLKGDLVARSVILNLFIFAVGSLVHQIFYFRPVWFLLGFALAKTQLDYCEEDDGV